MHRNKILGLVGIVAASSALQGCGAGLQAAGVASPDARVGGPLYALGQGISLLEAGSASRSQNTIIINNGEYAPTPSQYQNCAKEAVNMNKLRNPIPPGVTPSKIPYTWPRESSPYTMMQKRKKELEEKARLQIEEINRKKREESQRQNKDQ